VLSLKPSMSLTFLAGRSHVIDEIWIGSPCGGRATLRGRFLFYGQALGLAQILWSLLVPDG
jgi:hypothetical protein